MSEVRWEENMKLEPGWPLAVGRAGDCREQGIFLARLVGSPLDMPWFVGFELPDLLSFQGKPEI